MLADLLALFDAETCVPLQGERSNVLHVLAALLLAHVGLHCFLALLRSRNRLNNCVGRSNYRYFVTLLLSTFFMTSIQLGLSLWFVILYHSGNSSFGNRGAVELCCIAAILQRLHPAVGVAPPAR